MSIYLYRYIYELYIKVLYVFSGASEDQVLDRLEEFFNNKNWKFEEIQKHINDKFLPLGFKDSHREKYRDICRFVHPNYESFQLHLNITADQQFEFLGSNINLTVWHIIEIIRCFSTLRLLGLDENINQVSLDELQIIG